MSKKILLSFSGVLLSAAPILSVVSCGTSNESFSETFIVEPNQNLFNSKTEANVTYVDWNSKTQKTMGEKIGLSSAFTEEEFNNKLKEKFKASRMEVEFLSDGAQYMDAKTMSMVDIKKGEKVSIEVEAGSTIEDDQISKNENFLKLAFVAKEKTTVKFTITFIAK